MRPPMGIDPGYQRRRRLGRASHPGPHRPLHRAEGNGQRRRQDLRLHRRPSHAHDAFDRLRPQSVRRRDGDPGPGAEMSPTAEFLAELDEKGTSWRIVEHINDVIEEADVIYMEPVVQPDYTQCRQDKADEYGMTPANYRITNEVMKKAKGDSIVLHSLPRMDELLPEVDQLKHARYWQEAYNGVVMRMALLALVLGGYGVTDATSSHRDRRQLADHRQGAPDRSGSIPGGRGDRSPHRPAGHGRLGSRHLARQRTASRFHPAPVRVVPERVARSATRRVRRRHAGRHRLLPSSRT